MYGQGRRWGTPNEGSGIPGEEQFTAQLHIPRLGNEQELLQ